jgi:hypothetical protein
MAAVTAAAETEHSVARKKAALERLFCGLGASGLHKPPTRTPVDLLALLSNPVLHLRGSFGRLNQLANMNRQKTTNMMMRMCLISMAVPLEGKGWG